MTLTTQQTAPAAESAPSPRPGADGDAPIVLFDGVCNLCNGSVDFIIARDPDAAFRFASLQSEVGRALLRRHGLPEDDLASIVLVEGERCSTASEAALRVARRLRGPWRMAAVFLLVPRVIRDGVYGIVAAHRYRWFGKQNTCRVPTPELRARFLDADSPDRASASGGTP